MCKSLSWLCEQLRGRSICRSWRLLTIKTYTGWIQSFPITCTQCHVAHVLGVLDLASRLVSLLVPCIPAGLECCVRVPGLLIILFPTLSPILFCSRPCLPACFFHHSPSWVWDAVADSLGSSFLLCPPPRNLPRPVAEFQNAPALEVSGRMTIACLSFCTPCKFDTLGLQIYLENPQQAGKMPSNHVFCHVLSLEVTLVMSCRAPQFEERSIWCMIGSSHE